MSVVRSRELGQAPILVSLILRQALSSHLRQHMVWLYVSLPFAWITGPATGPSLTYLLHFGYHTKHRDGGVVGSLWFDMPIVLNHISSYKISRYHFSNCLLFKGHINMWVLLERGYCSSEGLNMRKYGNSHHKNPYLHSNWCKAEAICASSQGLAFFTWIIATPSTTLSWKLYI